MNSIDWELRYDIVRTRTGEVLGNAPTIEDARSLLRLYGLGHHIQPITKKAHRRRFYYGYA